MAVFPRRLSIAFVVLALACSSLTSAQIAAPDQHAGALSPDVSPQHLRKTLAFGPAASKGHGLVTHDVRISDSLAEISLRDAGRISLQLARSIANTESSGGKDFYIRDDSYIDSSSGLVYVYVKQTVNGLDVEDGNMNVVLSSTGDVLSYGNSLYAGHAPAAFASSSHSPTEYSEAECASLRESITGSMLCTSRFGKRDQMVFASDAEDEAGVIDQSHASVDLHALQRELYLHCEDPSDSPYLQGADFGSRMPGAVKHENANELNSGNDQIIDVRLAAVEFVKLATADKALASRLSASPSTLEQAASDISLTFEQSMRPDGRSDQVVHLHSVPGTTGAVAARLGYAQTVSGELQLVWRMNVPMDHQKNSNFYQITVDASTGEVKSSADWVASAPMHVHDDKPDAGHPEAYYKVLHWGLNDPTEGNRTLEQGALDKSASPYGWHSVGGKKTYNDTRGNNVFASAFGAGMDDWREPERKRPVGKAGEDGSSLVFDFPFPWRAADKRHEDLSPDTYADASTVNLFYTLNKYHDLLYLYGFTPAAGNFEEAESSEGGKGGDAIVAFSISSAGINNADFTTPPDGSKPRVRMYKWHTKENATERDGDFEEGIIVHEMTHGVSTRLTGGPADSSCLGWGESGGMGEGWGDFMATIIRRKTPTRDIYTMGSWASHQKAGIRRYPYSTNLTLNPETYKSLDAPGYWGVHAIGEVWAGMLYQVEEGLRAKLGWSPDLFPPSKNASQAERDEFWLKPDEVDKLVGGKARANKRPVPRHGNTLALQLIVDGMKLHPCRPSFFDARDAIILADKHLTGGANECLLWSRFAQRGLGFNAKVVGRTPWGGGVRSDGHQVPLKCKDEQE